MIEIQDITKVYRLGDVEVRALNGVSFRVDPGDWVAIMGPSGSGKSTLMNIIGCLDQPTSGSYKLDGLEVASMKDEQLAAVRNRKIGFVFQTFNLLSRTTALANVELPLVYAGSRDRRQRAVAALERVGLSERLNHRPNELSGGQQQRVAIARALINEPSIILADEPTGNLDSRSGAEIMDIFRQLHAQGLTIVMVTHDPEIGAQCRRVVHIRDGQVTSDERIDGETSGPPEAAYAGPANGHQVAELSPAVMQLAFAEENPAMNLMESMRIALRSLSANKLRSALTMLGIIIGVAAVIALMGVGRGASKAIDSQINSMGTNLLFVSPGSTSQNGVRTAQGSAQTLTYEDALALNDPESLPAVAAVAPQVQAFGQVVYMGNNVNTPITGVTADYGPVRNYTVADGEFISQANVQAKSAVAVVGANVATHLFPDASPVGQSVRINNITFKVIGVLTAKGGSGFGNQDDQVLVPITTAMARLGRSRNGGGNVVSQISVQVVDAKQMDAAIEQISTVLRERHHIRFDDDFTVRSQQDMLESATQITGVLTLFLGGVAGISLLVGGIGIMNIMLVSVTERTREIGIRKAIGATRRNVLSQFLTEATILSVLGGLIGVAVGAGIAQLISGASVGTMTLQPVIALDSILLATLFSLFVGLFFGIYPAYRAASLNPIDALHYE